MKQLLGIFVIGILLTAFPACSSEERSDQSTESLASGKDTADSYTCPMHPSVISDRPGACPVCGMALVRVSDQHEMTKDDLDHIRAVSLSPTQRVLANVSITQPERSTFTRTVSAVGVVDVAEPLQASLAARFQGRIERLHVSYTGERVSMGDPLLELYSPDLISAEQDLLLALDAVSPAGDQIQSRNRLLETSRTRLKVHFGMTEEQIRSIESTHTLQQTLVFHAPISGTVLRKYVQEGQYVMEGTPLYQVADLSRVWIYLDVYEQDIRHLRAGQEVVIHTDAYPNESFRGKVVFIDPVMNTQTRTIRVRTEFSNANGKLKPQMFVSASINIPIRDALVIPASALLSTGSTDIVWVEVEENTFEPRPVTVGTRSSILVEILSGLHEGERIVKSGGYLIDSESQLRSPTRGDAHVHDTPGDSRAETNVPDQSTGEVAESNDIRILVKGSYTPSTIRVKQGKPVVLRFFRDERSACTEEVVFESLGIRKQLAAFKETEVRFTPEQAGEIRFSCGMNMVHGKIIVER